MDNRKRNLNRMATWTITVFATAFAVVMSVMWLLKYPTTPGSSLQVVTAVLSAVWLIVVITALLCIATYFSYSYYLNRKR